MGRLSQLRNRASLAWSLGLQLPRQPHPPRGEPAPVPPAPATCSATCPAAASAASVPGGPWGRGDWGHLRFGNVPRWSCPSPLHARTCMCTHTHRCAQPSRAEDALGVPGVCCSQPRVESGWDSLAATADFIPLFTAKQRTQQRCGVCLPCGLAQPEQCGSGRG